VYDLTNVPGRPRIVQHAARDLGPGASSRVDDADLPRLGLDQRGDGMAQVDLVRPSGQAMQDDKHGLVIIGWQSRKLLIGVVGGTARQVRVVALKWLSGKVDGEAALVDAVVRLEQLAAVVDLGAIWLGGRPEGLQVAVEEQGVQVARRHGLFAHFEQIRLLAIFALKRARRRGVGEVEGCTSEPLHGELEGRVGRQTYRRGKK
jgi:hypothetical protein